MIWAVSSWAGKTLAVAKVAKTAKRTVEGFIMDDVYPGEYVGQWTNQT